MLESHAMQPCESIAPKPREAGILSPPFRRTTLGVVSLTSVVAFEALAVATAMPVAAADLNAVTWYALIFAISLATSVVGIAAAGAWSDARGAAPPTWAALAMLLFGLALSGVANDLMVLLIGRAITGFGLGAIGVTLYVVAVQAYPEHLHARVLSAFSAAWAIPALVGPAISGLIVDTVGWRWVFWLAVVIAVPSSALLAPALRRLPRPKAMDDPVDGQLPWAWLTAVGLGLAHAAGHEWNGLSVAALLFGLGALVCGARTLLPAGTLTLAPGLPAIVATRGMAAAAFFAAEAFVPLLLVERYAYSPTAAGLALTGAALSWAGGAQLHARGQGQHAPRRELRRGNLLMMGGLGGILAVVNFALPAYWIVLAWTLMGLAMGLQRPALGVLLIRASAADAIGRSASSLQMSDAIAIAGALAVTGAAFAMLHGTHPTLAYTLAFGISIVAVVLASVGVERLNDG